MRISSEFFSSFPGRRPASLNLDSLYGAVPGGALVEGAKVLHPTVLDILQQSAERDCFVRCQPSRQEAASAWTCGSSQLLSRGRDLVESLPCNFGDFDYFDEGCNCYLYTCDDCPVVYVASRSRPVSALVEAAPDCVFPIGYDDRYYRYRTDARCRRIALAIISLRSQFSEIHGEDTEDRQAIRAPVSISQLGLWVSSVGRQNISDNELFLPSSPYYSEHYLERLTAFIEGCDVLVTDAAYTDTGYLARVGWGHSCVSQVAGLAHAANVKNLCLFHHDLDQNDEDIDAKLASVEKRLRELGSSTICKAPVEGDLICF